MADNAMMFMLVVCLFLLISVALTATDTGDLAILNEFKKGMQNPELLNWPANDDDPCGPPSWKYVFCAGSRVTQIQSKNLGLVGSLPKDFNKLSKLSNLGLQNNNLTGPLPSFSGLSDLRYAYLDNNNFTSIPADFFDGLDSLETMAIDYNPLNATTGWSLPNSLENSAQLTELSLMSCNLVGPLPDFLGRMPSLTQLRLSFNRISGGIPASFNGSNLQVLWLNGQGTGSSDGDDDGGGGMTGPIDVIATMTSLTSLWLHGNQFNGTIPKNIGDLASLTDLNVNTNDLVGLIPESLAGMDLVNLDLNNNHFMGPIPHFKVKNASYSHNQFCQSTPGEPCAPQVMVLLDFLAAVSYPLKLVESWSGNEPCGGGEEWLGLACNSNQQVIVINLPGYRLNGTLSPSVAKLDALTKVLLRNNNIFGPVPSNWTSLKSLEMLDLSGNNISPPLPKFRTGVTVQTDNNPLFAIDGSSAPPTSVNGGPGSSTPGTSSSPSPGGAPETGNQSMSSKLAVIVAPIASFAGLMLLLVPLSLYFYCKRREPVCQSPSSLVIQPRDPSDPDDTVKVVVANNTNWGTSVGSGSASRNSSGIGESHVIDAGNLVISVQILRKVTKQFAPENELGRGGFGVVYKGEFDDGTQIAVKRMEAGIITLKAVNEFQSEIAVLSKVRHRHLVSLLGYSIEGNERLLVYEYMPQGALSKHLFHWKSLKLEPLSWKRRLNIALDVARGMEYLHNLCHHSFIHRDLKSSNILLGDDFRAKVADFGLVKAAPDGNNKSVVTRLAGTFGYLAPEYAVTGKITTKADVFSFGVVLMELLTGLMALDEDRPEEKQYLAAWFWRIKSDKETLLAGIDPALDAKEEKIESIVAIAELAGHCTAREPSQRPDMGHAVNILSQLVEKWKPLDDETEEYAGIDYSLPLTQMVKGWQEAEGKDLSYMDLEDSKGSIPARPTGFAESFTSVDGR